MDKVYSLFTITILLLIVVSPALSEDVTEPEVIIKIGTIAPQESSYARIIQEAIKEAEVRCRGRLRIMVYSGGIMGDEASMVRKIRLNQLQAGIFTVPGIQTIAPEMLVLSLPFMFQGFDEVDHIRERMFDTFNRIFEEKGFVLLAWVDAGGFAMFFTQEPIRTPEDLQRQRVWTWAGEPLSMENFKALGVNPIPIPLPEVLSALKTGLVNVVYGNPLACVALQWYPHIKYVNKADAAYGPVVMVVSKKVWDDAPEDIKRIVSTIIRKRQSEIVRVARKDDDLALVGMFKRGIKVVRYTPEELQVFKDLSITTWDKLKGKMYPDWLLNELTNELEKYRKEVKSKNL